MQLDINENTIVTKGYPLSPNFLLDHVTSGAYHYVMGKWAPNFSMPISTFKTGQTPLWKIAANLQMGAESILEPLLNEFGGDLIIRSGLTPGNMGSSLGIQVNGFEGNMYNLMPMIQQIANRASSISFVQGTTSYANINFNSSSIQNGFSSELPQLFSIDTINNLNVPGLQMLKGFL